MRLDFLAVGPQKSGTTWLDAVLREHPNVALPFVKETFFFDANFAKGEAWYAAQFRGEVGRKMVGEVAPSLFHHAESPARVHALYPGIKFLVTLRHPLARLQSHYQHLWRLGHVGDDFQQAVTREPEIVRAGQYRACLQRWEAVAVRHGMFLETTDMIASDPEAVWARVIDFLGLDYCRLPSIGTEWIYQTTAPKYRFLATVAGKISRVLQQDGHHKTLQFARRLRLNRVYGAGGNKLPRLPVDQLPCLLQQFEADIAYVEQKLGRELNTWREVPAAMRAQRECE